MLKVTRAQNVQQAEESVAGTAKASLGFVAVQKQTALSSLAISVVTIQKKALADNRKGLVRLRFAQILRLCGSRYAFFCLVTLFACAIVVCFCLVSRFVDAAVVCLFW